ncbi:unnamed protein product [Acanthoscelides obtectus]|uniref:HAT C-terminal dimerisation domain-containing protein n=1 Tax=Acanthoscelides obtectus TaxID=200917 RepID=A0A9P0PP88_ACAOB|nr:unnamed protein product [Acanthoscelides obtectus]CAK1648283.1 hypothetical protein AOBTE_LOCUS15644 [Acanthoscelides obtectus]
MNNVFSFSILGKLNIRTQLNSAYRNDLIKHNNQVDKNRYVLNKIINCIRFCGAFELALRGHDEKENSENRCIFKELVNFSAELDNELKVHIQSAKLFKGTSKTTQNELLECMLDVYHEEVKKEIANSPFVAVIADETTDVACEFQYLCKGQPVERFWRFYVPDGHDAKSIAACVLNVVNPLIDQNPNKLIAQSYDGASVMSDKNRLKTELQVLYQREELSTTSGAVPLSILLNEEGLNCTFQETLKLLSILITIPMSTSEAERSFSMLKRIKTFLRNTMKEERLSALGMLSAEKHFVSGIENFNNKVFLKPILFMNARQMMLVITDMTCETYHDNLPLVKEDFHHPSLFVVCETKFNATLNFDTNVATPTYNFRKADFIGLYNALTYIDWSFLDNVENV